MIKSIIFDLGNVIVNVDKSDFYKKIAEASGKSIAGAKDCCENSPARRDFERGKLSPQDFYRSFSEELSLTISFKEFARIYCDIFTLNKNVAEIIKKLKKRFRLILLSNTDEIHFEFIKKKFKITRIFDDYVLSYQAKCRKPNPLIFFDAIKKAGALPFNIAYFDDIPEFVLIARLMGIKAFQYKSFKKLIGDLRKVEILKGFFN